MKPLNEQVINRRIFFEIAGAGIAGYFLSPMDLGAQIAPTTQQPATAGIGSSIADQATVSSGYSPTGTVTFRLYDNSSATGSPLFTDTKTLSAGSATSSGYPTAALGTYYWVATYNGDANNNTASSGTADEPVTVTHVTPSISTTQQPTTAVVCSYCKMMARAKTVVPR